MLADDFVLMDMLFEAEQYLIRINRFDKIVGNFLTDSLLHNTLLLTLGNHHHRQFRMKTLNLLQGFESCQAGHILIEKDDVQGFGPAYIDSILPIVGGKDFIVFVAQIDDIGFEKVDLVVCP